MPKIIYLDNHATTPLDPQVLRAMMPFFKEKFGNSASHSHALGREAKNAVEKSRTKIAQFLGATQEEIIFTSGATESNNLAIKGAALANKDRGLHVITVATEHKSVLDSFKRLALFGYQVTYLPVKRDGLLDIEIVKKAIRKDTVLLSIMMAHNEIGVIQPIAEIAKIAQEKKILFHSDASQAAGKIALDVKALGVDFLSITAHKIYGPKGVGVLFIKKNKFAAPLMPILDGGGHEQGYRSGTLNVPGIVGLAKACELSMNFTQEAKKLSLLRDELKEGILKIYPESVINGSQDNRLPNNLNISFPNINGESFSAKLHALACSRGSACISTSPEPSYVLKALGVSEELRSRAFRFGVGRFNSRSEIKKAVKIIEKALKECKDGRS